MPDMIAKLDLILAHLRRLGRPSADLLQPPLTLAQIERLATRLPFALTTEVETLYQWHNGTRAQTGDDLDDLHFFPGFYFLSLEEALETYVEREDADQWRKGWLPIFANGAGDFYVVPCKRKKVSSTPIIGFLHGEPDQIAEYESLEAMIQTLEACFREGVFYVDDDDTLEMDDDRHAELAQRYNPTLEAWRS
jgi:cell wall assembly regulator SMI1